MCCIWYFTDYEKDWMTTIHKMGLLKDEPIVLKSSWISFLGQTWQPFVKPTLCIVGVSRMILYLSWIFLDTVTGPLQFFWTPEYGAWFHRSISTQSYIHTQWLWEIYVELRMGYSIPFTSLDITDTAGNFL